MVYYCPKCGNELKFSRYKKNEKFYSYKALIINIVRIYKCPNDCVLQEE